MALINVPDIQNLDAATPELWNSRFATIVNAINGNLDDTNLAANAVTASRLATDSVITGKILNLAVTTAKLEDDAVTAQKMLYGLVRGRRGGTTGDNTWATTGTSNTDTSSKDVFIQCGTILASTSTDLEVLFPTAYNQVPIIMVTVASATSYNTSAMALNARTTGFDVRCQGFDQVRRAELVFWIAIGQ